MTFGLINILPVCRLINEMIQFNTNKHYTYMYMYLNKIKEPVPSWAMRKVFLKFLVVLILQTLAT